MIGCTCPTCTSNNPKDKRLRTSAIIQYNGCNIQIDVGPDFRQQMLTHQINKLDAILITHQHSDHTSGIDEIRAFNFIENNAIFPMYAEQWVLDDIKNRFRYIFEKSDYPGLPSIKLFPIEAGCEFDFNGITILPIKITHGQKEILAYRIDQFAYVTDCSYISKESMSQLMNLDVLILNSLRQKQHHSHFTLLQALEVIEILKPKKAFLTHISHQMGLHSEIEKLLPANVQLAYDTCVINL